MILCIIYVDEEKHTKWEQWGGVLQRGYSTKLILFRTNPPRMCQRAPGSGAIQTMDWAPVARKQLKKRNCVLHTDGAKGYQLEIEGLKHDHVVHKTRKLVRNGKPVKKNGRFVWIKPQYTKTFTHTAASSKQIKCKGGTQVIDCFWRHLHGYLKHRSFAVRSLQFATRVRSAQWAYWHRHDDLWLETGKMLRRLSVA